MAAGVPSLRLVRGAASEQEIGSARSSTPKDAAARRRELLDVAVASARRDASRLRFLVFCLCGFGLVMVLASSSVTSIGQYGSPWSLFERQAMWTVIGTLAYALMTRLSLERLRRMIPLFLAMSVAMLLAVLVPHLGSSAGGSSRWIGAGPLSIQPSEITKVAFALFVADLVERREDRLDQWRELVRPMLLVLGIVGILIVKQPDLGTALVLACMSIGALYAAGVRRGLLAGVVGGLAAVAGIVALVAPYRRARLFSFVNPFGHASSTGYQVVQSLVALGSGGISGRGVGASAAIWGWLPNAQTDFVFAVVGAQLGFVGTVAVLLAFGYLGWLGLRIAARAEDRLSSLVATALTCWIVCQALINIGGVVGALPETGIPLPFVSSGGSSLVVVLAAMGILTRIARRAARALEVRR